jgi:hypothetical protein
MNTSLIQEHLVEFLIELSPSEFYDLRLLNKEHHAVFATVQYKESVLAMAVMMLDSVLKRILIEALVDDIIRSDIPLTVDTSDILKYVFDQYYYAANYEPITRYVESYQQDYHNVPSVCIWLKEYICERQHDDVERHPTQLWYCCLPAHRQYYLTYDAPDKSHSECVQHCGDDDCCLLWMCNISNGTFSWQSTFGDSVGYQQILSDMRYNRYNNKGVRMYLTPS